MKTISLVACNRLHYLVQTVECLKRNNVDGYTLFLGVEPVDQTVVEYCRKLDFMPVHLTVNPARLGVAWNPRATIGRAFKSGSEFNVAIEDDLLLAPDALDLTNWFCGLNDPGYFSLNLCNYRSDPSFPSEVEESSHFIPLGWAVTRVVWQTLIEPEWMCDARGWDFSVNKVLGCHATRKVLQPKLARSNHNGREGGEHCSAEFHDRTFRHLSMSDGSKRDYHLLRSSEARC
jgi:hypothetical protein